jgi:hypothetical protein
MWLPAFAVVLIAWPRIEAAMARRPGVPAPAA